MTCDILTILIRKRNRGFNMLVLTRKGIFVFQDKVKLTIVAQASKGANKEVVKIDGLPGSNGQKWISLSTLKEGLNNLNGLKGREVTVSTKSYALTSDEQTKVDKLQAQIDVIVNAAKARYVPKPKLDVNPATMTKAEREAKYAEIKKYFNL